MKRSQITVIKMKKSFGTILVLPHFGYSVILEDLKSINMVKSQFKFKPRLPELNFTRIRQAQPKLS